MLVESYMTTGIPVDDIIKLVESKKLSRELDFSDLEESEQSQLAVDAAGALNRVIKGNSAACIPCLSEGKSVVVKINGKGYDLISGNQNNSTEIPTLRYTPSTYVIEDAIRSSYRKFLNHRLGDKSND